MQVSRYVERHDDAHDDDELPARSGGRTRRQDGERELLRRVLRMTRPYRGALIGFLIAVIAAAMIGVIPALLFRSLIDTAVPDKNQALVLGLAVAAVVIALTSAMLSLIQRWYSARVGEGLIYDMRVALFDHVQRLPISFFTRTQTGSLTEPAEQRRDRGAAGRHDDARHRRLERHQPRGDTRLHARPRVAADHPHPDRAAGVHHPGAAHRAPATGRDRREASSRRIHGNNTIASASTSRRSYG